jgi:chromosome segregation ATPase
MIVRLYGKLLDSVNELGFRDEAAQILTTTYERRSSHLESKMTYMQADITNLQESLDQALEREAFLQSRVTELEAITSTLTEWNTHLEQQTHKLTFALEASNLERNQELQSLHSQIITVTEKRIEMQGDYSRLEEENVNLRNGMRELRDVQSKLLQENAILKSKLFGLMTKRNSCSEATIRESHTIIAIEMQRPGKNEAATSPQPAGTLVCLSPTIQELCERPLQFDTVSLDSGNAFKDFMGKIGGVGIISS